MIHRLQYLRYLLQEMSLIKYRKLSLIFYSHKSYETTSIVLRIVCQFNEIMFNIVNSKTFTSMNNAKLLGKENTQVVPKVPYVPNVLHNEGISFL